MVAAAGAERVELDRSDLPLLKPLPCRAVGPDRPGRRDMVGGHAVTQHQQGAGIAHVAYRRWIRGHAVKERRPPHIRGLVAPVVGRLSAGRNRLPLRGTLEDCAVPALKHLGLQRFRDGCLDVCIVWPEIPEVDVIAVGIGAERLGGEIKIERSGDGVRHDQSWRGQPVGPDIRMNPPFEVPVARQDGRHGEALPTLDSFDDRRIKRSGVADTRGAAIPDQVKSEFVERLRQVGGVKIVGHDLTAGCEAGLDPGLALQAPFACSLRE